MRRVVAVEVQAAFADGDDLRMLRELAQRGNGLRIALARVVRMHAGRGVQAVRCGEFGCVPAFLDRGAGDDDGVHARGARAREHRVEVLAETTHA